MKEENIRSRIICSGESFNDSIVVYEKGRKPQTYIIINESTQNGSKDKCVNLTSDIYGYDVTYECITKEAHDEIVRSSNPKEPELYIITFRTITTQFSCSFVEKLWMITRVDKSLNMLDKVAYMN